MRVEQRIGRLDRIGQRAEKITIWNLMYDDTIDSRIYDRLYERLNIFERALGGLEAILGEEIRKLTNALLRGQLDPEQELQRIDQTAVALENRRNDEERLENDAASLVAHGDYILNQIRAARELHRWISGQDLRNYVIPFVRERYPGSRLQIAGNEDDLTYDIALNNELKHELDEFLKAHGLYGQTSLARLEPEPIRCRFENKATAYRAGRLEIISQFHPLVRFVSSKLNEEESSWHNVVALRLPMDETEGRVPAGDYVFVVQRWSATGVQVRERLFFAAGKIATQGALLGEDDAERLVVAAASKGNDWLKAANFVDLNAAEELGASLALDIAERAYRRYVEQVSAENNDRADVQEATVKRHLDHQREQQRRVRDQHLMMGRTSLAKAIEGKIEKLENRVERQILKINNGRQVQTEKRDVCFGIVRVEAK